MMTKSFIACHKFDLDLVFKVTNTVHSRYYMMIGVHGAISQYKLEGFVYLLGKYLSIPCPPRKN